MHQNVVMFLRARDRARAVNDPGLVRALTADLRRLGVSDAATLADPEGHPRNGTEPVPKGKGGRPKLPRCEHDMIASRCPECSPEEAA